MPLSIEPKSSPLESYPIHILHLLKILSNYAKYPPDFQKYDEMQIGL